MKLSILITHYNRPDALLKCIDAIKNINWEIDYEIIVSDDGSKVENIERIKLINNISLLLSEKNQGLAANINKGINACKGNYILYCQEDFLIVKDLELILNELYFVLDNNKLDLVRLRANYSFPFLNKITNNVFEIPKFSWKNFLYNAFQYSDNLFITTPSFFVKNGLYLENTSGDYGEAEYAIRIFNSKAKIGITKRYYSQDVVGSESVMRKISAEIKRKNKLTKKLKQYLRAFRLHIERLLYNPQKRGLVTYKNKRRK